MVERKKTRKTKRGFTFIEVMVAAIILSSGMVSIYKVFIATLGYLNHLSCRSYATTVLNNKITEFAQRFQLERKILFGTEADQEKCQINNKWVDFKYTMSLMPMGKFDDLFLLNGRITWVEGRKHISLSRSVLLAQLNPRE